MREIMGDQTANEAANPLKKGKKNKKHQFWNYRIAVLVFLCYSFRIQTCLCVSLRQFWNSPVVGGRWVGYHRPMAGGL
jgi:hypothetical protein